MNIDSCKFLIPYELSSHRVGKAGKAKIHKVARTRSFLEMEYGADVGWKAEGSDMIQNNESTYSSIVFFPSLYFLTNTVSPISNTGSTATELGSFNQNGLLASLLTRSVPHLPK